MLNTDFNKNMFSFKPPEINPIDYEDTIFKDMANDIISSQSQIENKLDNMVQENEKSSKTSFKIALWTLILAILTLIATIVGIFV